ncbi:Uncharacterised protein [uncultured archaeon]|nr:Uncharacterised protein [uncultured archaeon]
MSGERTELTGFHEEIANVQAAIADFESGKKLNIAIIAEPFAGRTAIANEIEKINAQKVTRLNLSCPVKSRTEIALPGQSKRIVIIDNCHFLYMRKIGGFEIIEELLKLIENPDIMFITTWNLYSWKYLDEVIKIGKFFPVQISLPKLTADQIKESILSGYDKNEIKFLQDVGFENEKITDFAKYQVMIKPLNKAISIPYLKINYDRLKVRLSRKKKVVAIEDLIFEKIKHISNGNPGVAGVIWQRSLEHPVIKPGNVKELSFNIDLDYDEYFILSIILSMDSVGKRELAEIEGFEYQIDEIIFRLLKQGLIVMEDNNCRINPEALGSIVEFLKRSRLVW